MCSNSQGPANRRHAKSISEAGQLHGFHNVQHRKWAATPTGETAELPWPPRWSIHVRRDGKAIRNLSRAFHLLESKGSKWDASITFKGRLEEGFLGGVGGAWGRGKHRGRERG